MKVLLTGGSGLVGKRLAPMLAERHELTHFEQRDPDRGGRDGHAQCGGRRGARRSAQVTGVAAWSDSTPASVRTSMTER